MRDCSVERMAEFFITACSSRSDDTCTTFEWYGHTVFVEGGLYFLTFCKAFPSFGNKKCGVYCKGFNV